MAKLDVSKRLACRYCASRDLARSPALPAEARLPAAVRRSGALLLVQNSQPSATRPMGWEPPVPRATPPDSTRFEVSRWCTMPKPIPLLPL